MAVEVAGQYYGDDPPPALRASLDGALHVLFMFDPRRQVILLIGGDKSGDWNAWYDKAIPLADDLYDLYLDELRDEGLI